MYAIAILFMIIGGAVSTGGVIAWIAALLGLITSVTPLEGFSILCIGAVIEVLALVIFFLFRPKIEDIGDMMGSALGGMMEGMEKGLNRRNF